MPRQPDGGSYREHTGAIRHLDAARAREIVDLFTRPVVADEQDLGYDAADPVLAATHGLVSLERAGAAAGSPDVVGHYRSHLYLHGLVRLPPSVARELARHRGHLYLDGLTSITDTTAAELAKHPCGGLSLNNLRRLSAAAATALGRHHGELSFDRITQLDAAAAAGLAAHASELYLGGLRTISPAAAAALALHRGDLCLEHLPHLPGRVAAHLARHGGKLHLHGVSLLTDAAASACGGRTGFLCLKNLRRLSPAQARLLAGHVGELQLHALELDDAVAACLGAHRGALLLRVPDDLPLQRLESLVRHAGPLELPGLARLDEPRARVLAAQAAPGGARGLSGLFLSGVGRITPAVAAILATHRAGGLALAGLRTLSEDVARELVAHPILALDGVETLTDRVAGILAAHAGTTLSLKRLQHVGAAALARLRDNPGIELPRRLLEPSAGTCGRGGPDMVPAIERIARLGEEALRR